jgi:hypothetical protein
MTTFMWLILVLFLITVGVLLGMVYTLNYFRDERQRSRYQRAEYQANVDPIQPTELEWYHVLAQQRRRDEARRQRR